MTSDPMWRGNPHRDHPLKIAGVIALVLLAWAAVFALWSRRYGWDPLGLSSLFGRHPVVTAGAVFAFSVAFFAYEYRFMARPGKGLRRFPASIWSLVGSALALVCVLIGTHGPATGG